MPAQLRFQEIAPRKAFHAALVTQPGAYGTKVMLHSHDFWELMYVVEGRGVHWFDEEPQPLVPGDLLLIRPKDVHAIRQCAGQYLHFLNIAFLERPWRDFCSAAQLTPTLAVWTAAAQPYSVSVSGEARAACASAFERALHAFVTSPSHLELCALWCTVLPFMSQPLVEPGTAPVWLERACQKMREPSNLRVGLPRLTALCGVSQAHLARTLRYHYGQTPTEYVNDLRLQQAAKLLTTTSAAIVEIAGECGFDNLSYFYRRFSKRFGNPPRAFRLQATRQIVPQ